MVLGQKNKLLWIYCVLFSLLLHELKANVKSNCNIIERNEVIFFSKIKSQCLCLLDRFTFLDRLWKYINAKSRIIPGIRLHWLEEKITSYFPTWIWLSYISNGEEKNSDLNFAESRRWTQDNFSTTRFLVQHSRCCSSAWSRPRFHQRCHHQTPLLLLRRRTNRQAGASPGKTAREKLRVMSAHLRREYVFITTGINADVCWEVLAAHTRPLH